METPGADLILRRADPLNCEVRLSRLADGDATPNDRFYIRNHFPVPKIDAERWRPSVTSWNRPFPGIRDLANIRQEL